MTRFALPAFALIAFALPMAWFMGANIEATDGPRTKSSGASGRVVLNGARDGHFYARAEINGRTVRMLADTGASMVVLSEADAEDIGLDVDGLDFIHTVSTAGGEAAAAEVTLDEVRVGGIVRENVRALVTRGLPVSLLGMNFFNSLTKVAMESGELVLED